MIDNSRLIVSSSARETLALGEKIGQALAAGDVVALYGELGSGKTTLIQGIAKGLGIKGLVNSPTFIIANEYLGRSRFFHIDLYRLNSAGEAVDMGIEEYFLPDAVSVVEWAERLGKLLPEKAFDIRIEILEENKRQLCISSGLAARLQ